MMEEERIHSSYEINEEIKTEKSVISCEKDTSDRMTEETIVSFEQYCREQFGPAILDELRLAIANRHINIGRKLNKVKRIDLISIDEMIIQRMLFYDAGEGSVMMDAIVSVCMTCWDIPGFVAVEEKTSQWFTVSSVCNLEKGIWKSLKHIEIYNSRIKRSEQQLTEYLMPVISYSGIERAARRMVENNKTWRGNHLGMYEILSMADNMGLKIIDSRLSIPNNVFATIVFEKKKNVETFFKNGNPRKRNIDSPSILLDQNAAEAHDVDIISILLHELFHYYFHRLFYLGQKWCNGTTELRLNCDSLYHSNSVLGLLEEQATLAAQHIRMPTETALSTARHLFTQYSQFAFDQTTICHQVITSFATRFSVSERSARTRLIELGFTELCGINEIIDGEEIPDYRTSSGKMPRGIRYSISESSFIELTETSADFRAVMSSGKFVYAEGHVCLLHPKYINKPLEREFYERSLQKAKGETRERLQMILCNLDSGKIVRGFKLTEYARNHIEECCLSFDTCYYQKAYSVQNGTLNSSNQDSSIAFTKSHNEKISADSIGFFMNDYDQATELMINTTVARRCEWSSLSLSETIKQLLIWRNATIENIAEVLSVSERTLRRKIHDVESGTGTQMQMADLICICVSLHLPEVLQEDLFRKAHFSFDNSREHFAYKTVLKYYYRGTVQEYNQILKYSFKLAPILPEINNNVVPITGKARYERHA